MCFILLHLSLWERHFSIQWTMPLTETAPPSPTHIPQQGTEAPSITTGSERGGWPQPGASHCTACDSLLPHTKGIPKVPTGLPNAVFPVFWHLADHLPLSYRKIQKNIWLHDQISNQGSWYISLQRALLAQCGTQTHHTHICSTSQSSHVLTNLQGCSFRAFNNSHSNPWILQLEEYRLCSIVGCCVFGVGVGTGNLVLILSSSAWECTIKILVWWWRTPLPTFPPEKGRRTTSQSTFCSQRSKVHSAAMKTVYIFPAWH